MVIFHSYVNVYQRLYLWLEYGCFSLRIATTWGDLQNPPWTLGRPPWIEAMRKSMVYSMVHETLTLW